MALSYTPLRDLLHDRVPMNLVAALMMMGPVGNRSLSIEDRVDSVFGILAGLTGVATLIQVQQQTG